MIIIPFGFMAPGVAPTPDDVDLLLNNFPYASGAFALRKLDKNYTGSCIKVRESSGNTLADIGFDANGDLDTTALLAHTGGNSGYVHTWYDQSGLGYNATQTTNGSQPRIVNSGTVEVLNTKPSIYFSGSEEFVISDIPALDSMVGLVVASQEASGDASPTIGGTNVSGNSPYVTLNWTDNKFYTKGGSGTYTVTSGTYTDTNQHLTAAAQSAAGTNITQWRDGEVISSSSVSSVTSTEFERIGRHGSTLQKGYLQEIVYYDEDRYPELTRLMSDVGAKYRGWSDYSLFSTDFDGISQYVDLGDTLDYGTFTISAWVKADVISVSLYEGIITKREASNPTKQFNLSLDNANKFYFWIFESDGTYIDVFSNSAIVVDTWYHVLAVADGSTLKMYVNGTLQTDTASYDGTFQNTGSTTKIGDNQGHMWTGNIDEVAYWNSDQSGNVTTIYNGGVPADLTDLSPTAWWRMGDESGHPYLTNKMAYSKYSMYFDGINDYASLTTPSDCGLGASNTFSISFWYKDTDSALDNINYDMLFANTDGGWETGMGIYYFNNTINFFVNSYSNNRATATFSAGTRQSWCHICAVYDGTLGSDNIKIYVNGTVGGTTDTLTANLTAISNAFHIGRSGTAALYLTPGNFDEVAIFNTALDATGTGSVDEIYNNGVPNDISGLNPVSYYRMGEGAIFPQIPNEMAYSKQSMNFDGATQYVTMGNVLAYERTDSFSISAWIKPSTLSGVADAIVAKQGSTAPSQYRGYMLYRNAGKIYVFFNSDGFSNKFTAWTTNTVLTVDTWHHVVMTYDGTSGTGGGISFYVDGASVAVTTDSTSLTSTIVDTTTFAIGGRGDTIALPFTGNIDDVSIFDSELTSGNVTTIHNNGVPNDISALSPVGWWKMGDGDYFPTLTDSGSGGNDGTAENMSGADIELETPNGWGTAYNDTAPEMIQGDTPGGNGGTMNNMSQSDIVQDAPTNNLLLNDYSGAAIAWSLRKLDKDYAGKPIKVRRLSDSVEVDVHFDTSDTVSLDSAITVTSGVSSATDLGEFMASSGYSDPDGLGSSDNAYVKTFYDQSGNGNDGNQTGLTQQPRIVNAGVVDVNNGKAALYFNGAYWFTLSSVTLASSYSGFQVVSKSAGSSYTGALDKVSPTASSPIATVLHHSYLQNIYIGNATTTYSVTQAFTGQIIWSNLNISGTISAYKDNGSALTLASYSESRDNDITSWGYAWKTTGHMQEVILYNSDESSNRADIVTNINDHYGTY